jgi:hypothetical protein
VGSCKSFLSEQRRPPLLASSTFANSSRVSDDDKRNVALTNIDRTCGLVVKLGIAISSTIRSCLAPGSIPGGCSFCFFSPRLKKRKNEEEGAEGTSKPLFPCLTTLLPFSRVTALYTSKFGRWAENDQSGYSARDEAGGEIRAEDTVVEREG